MTHKIIFSIVLLGVALLTKCQTTKEINAIYLEKLLANVNTTVDPCEDFYAYACGNWAQHHNLSLEYVDMPGYMDNKVNKQLFEIMQNHKSDSGIYEQIWKYYNSCVELHTPALNSYLRLVQKELNFVWPIFREDWHVGWQNKTEFDWLSTIAALRVYGLNGIIITQNINIRLKNGSHFIIEIHQHQPSQILLRKDVAEIFVNFGMTMEESKNVTEKIMELQNKMKNLTLNEEDAEYISNVEEMRIKELMEKLPLIDWRKYFQQILGREINIEKEMVQTLSLNLEYFEKLLSIINESSNETICYYIMLKFMYKLNDDLPIIGDKSLPCIKHLRGYMPLAMNFFYEHNIYSEKRNQTDTALIDIYNKLRSSFEKLLNDENYLKLNINEREYILAELRTMRIKIGNVPQKINREFVEKYYSKMFINISTNFYENHLQALKLGVRQQQSRLQNVAIPAEKHFYIHDPESASSSSPVKIFDNAILVPYGYLQLPFFHPNLNPLFQYSLLGFILAHEIIHAFDLFHIVYDQYSNYNELGITVAEHFVPHINCFALNPSDTLSENIADVSGLRLVYQTYFREIVNFVEEEEEEEKEKSSFTTQQLFFINSVQFLCANMLKISRMDPKTFNLEHDMHDERVRHNWANFEQFSEAFHCTNGTRMYPQKTCRLW